MNVLRISILCYGLALFTSCGDKSQTVYPERKDITEVVYASGNLYPETEYKVIANITGYLTDVMAVEGDSVKVGQALFAISESNRRSELETAAFALRTAMENAGQNSPVLAQLREKLSTANEKQKFDSLTLTRFRKLFDSGAIARAELERIETVYEASRGEYQAIGEQLVAQQKSLQLELAEMQNRFNMAKRNLGDAVIASQTHGLVYEINKQRGDFIHQNEVIALLGSGSRPVARLSIDESDYNLVKAGQEVILSFDAWPGKTFQAVIAKVYPKVNKAEQAIRADAVMRDTTFRGIYGMNLEANIILKTSKNCLSVPRQALLAGDSLRIRRDGKITQVHVRTGAGDLSRIEIVEGLQEKDEVFLTGESQ